MLIPPSPTIYTCTVCGWSKTVAPRGDALMPGEHFSGCPRCSHSPLDKKKVDTAEAGQGGLAEALKQLLR